jgi:hypothetical protein
MKKDYIIGFDSFLNEGEIVRETSPLVFSPKLKTILKKIDTTSVAKELLKSEGESLSDVSWLDIVKDDSKSVSALSTDRSKRCTPAEYWTTSLRNSGNWGKMINKLFPGKFTNVDIDAFYDRYRPQLDDKGDERFQLMRGDDVRIWYHEKKYNGEMGSCMRYDKCQKFFDIYTKNPEKCGLLVYLDESGDRAYGRCLVWNNLIKPSGDTKEDKEPYWLMDRVYPASGKQSVIPPLFKKYAIENGWLYKESDSFMLNGQRKTTSVTTRVKPVDHALYPYMDTMQYYTPATGRLSSTAGNPARDPNNPSRTFRRYNLRHQDGGHGNID